MTKKIDISPSNIECINISIAFCNNLITKIPQVGEQADAAITALENLGDAIITEESK